MKHLKRGATLLNVTYNIKLSLYEVKEAGKLYRMDLFILDQLKQKAKFNMHSYQLPVASWYNDLNRFDKRKIEVVDNSRSDSLES